MRKYTITLYHFNKGREVEAIEKLKTREMTEERVIQIMQMETLKNKNCAWEITPRPKLLKGAKP